jgi:hypothetical protein
MHPTPVETVEKFLQRQPVGATIDPFHDRGTIERIDHSGDSPQVFHRQSAGDDTSIAWILIMTRPIITRLIAIDSALSRNCAI